MFNWLKKLFGSDVPDTPEITKVVVKEETKVSKPATTKKPATKKTSAKKDTVDLDSMSKADLLSLAKEKGLKANASLKKADIISVIKKGK